MITQEDKDAAEWLYNNLPICVPSWNALTPADRAAMVHNAHRTRIAAEKAVMDRFDEDWLADIIQDSFEMDWTARDGARAIMRSIGLKT